MRREVLAAAIAVLVLWAPLPFGSVLPWAQTVVRLACFGLLLAAAWTWRRPRELRAALVPAGAVAAIGLLGVLQSLPWPTALVERLSPSHAALAGPVGATLSLAPEMSRGMAQTWLAVAALLLAAAVAGAERRSRRVLAAGVVASALVQALYGARRWLAHSPEIWGVPAPTSERLSGSFVNPDHLAMLLTIALAVTLAWFWVAYRAGRDAPLDRRVLWAAPPALAWLLLFVTLTFTGSRAGLVAGVAGAVATAGALAAQRRRLGVGTLGLLAPLLGMLAVAAIGLQAGLGRWLATSGYELTWNERLLAHQAAFELWLRFPITGAGLAGFREAFPLVQPAELEGTWWHAHNDFVELLATTGVVGGVLMAAGLMVLLMALARRLRVGRRSEDVAPVAAACGALTAVLLHSWVDFGLTLPANALMLAVVCGAALGGEVRGEESKG